MMLPRCGRWQLSQWGCPPPSPHCPSAGGCCPSLARSRDPEWHDMTWHDMTWHDMTWHDMTWGLLTMLIVFCSSLSFLQMLCHLHLKLCEWRTLKPFDSLWCVQKMLFSLCLTLQYLNFKTLVELLLFCYMKPMGNSQDRPFDTSSFCLLRGQYYYLCILFHCSLWALFYSSNIFIFLCTNSWFIVWVAHWSEYNSKYKVI